MKGKKLSAMQMFFVMGVTALFVCGAVYYYIQYPHPSTLDPRREEKQEKMQAVPVTTAPAKQEKVAPPTVSSESLLQYYVKRLDFINNTLTSSHKDPESLGFKKLATFEIACPPDYDGPCGGEMLLISKESVKSGNQQFYFAQAGGASYDYFGPFTGDLKRLVAESKTINTLNY